jgi:hypothetical protein
MLTSELCPRNTDWASHKIDEHFPNDSHDRWALGTGFHVDFPIQTAQSRIYGLRQNVLQAHLGPFLS